MRRFLKYILLAVVSLITVLIIAVGFIVATEAGTHFAWNMAREFLPEGLTIATVKGRLLGPLTVRGIDFSTKDFHLTIGESLLDWAPQDLLANRTLNIDRVAVIDVRYTQLRAAPPAPEKKSKPISLPRRIDLPLDTRLGKFLLQNVEYRATPDAKPVVLRGAVLSASFVGDRLTVGRLAIDAPLLSLFGRANITTRDKYPLKGTFDWEGRPPTYAAVNGHTGLSGSLHKLQIQQVIKAPYNTSARVVVGDPLKQPRFNAKLNVNNLGLQKINRKLSATTLNLALKTAGVPDDLELHARAAATDSRYGTLNLAFDGGFADQVATIQKLAVSSPERPARLNAHGQIALKGKQPKVNVEARWRKLRWPLSGNSPKNSLIASREGRLAIDGTLNAARARIRAVVNGTTLAQAGVKGEETLQAQFRGGFAQRTKTLKINKLKVAFAEQRLSTQGRVSLAGKQPELDLSANWRQLRWPLAGKPMVTSPTGAVALNGTPKDLRATLNIAVGEDGHISGAAKRAGDSIDLTLNWRRLRWPVAGEAQVKSSRGALDVGGTLAGIRSQLTATLSGPAISNAGIEDEQTLQANFRGGFARQVLNIEKFTLGLADQPTRIMAAGRVEMDNKQPTVDLDLGWRQVRWPLAGKPLMTSPKGEVTVNGTPQALDAKLDIGIGATGDIEGRANRMGEKIDLMLDWHKLQWPLTTPQVVSPAGNLAVTGALKDYRTKLSARVNSPPKHTSARIDLAGHGSLKFLDLTRIDVKALQGQLTGNARVAWKPSLQGRVALDADGLNPGEVLADWPGKLGLALRAAAGMRDDQVVAQFNQLNVGGRLRGNPLRLTTHGAFDPQGLKLDNFSLVSRDSVVEAEGFVGDTLDVGWRIKSPDLGQLLPNARGKINGLGSANGLLNQPKVEATLVGTGLRYQTFQLRELNLDADVDLSGHLRSRVDLALENGQAGGVALNKISLQGDGDAAAHSLALTARTSTGDADIALAGALEQPWQPDMLWRFELEKATLKYPQLAAWRLPSPITGRVDAERAQLSRGCWASGKASLCVQGERSPAGAHGTVEIEDLAFNYFARLLPPETRLDGDLSAHGEFDQPTTGPLAATLHLGTTAGRVASIVSGIDTQTGSDTEPTVASQTSTLLEFRPSAVDFEMDERGMHFASALRVADAGGIHLEADVPQGRQSLTARPLRGQLTAHLPDLSFIAQLVPDLGRFKGHLDGDMRFAGTLNTPEIYGNLALEDSSVILSGPGITLNGLRAELIGEGADGIQLDAGARSGGGTLHVGGRFKLAGDDEPRANIRIRGQDFQVVNTADARVSASPDLTVRARTGRVDVTGEVRVPHASITPKKLPASAVPVSSDQVIVESGDEAQTAEAAATDVHARVRLILAGETRNIVDDDLTDKINESPVHIDAFGLTAGFQGELLVVEKPGEPTQGSGELQIVDGTYQAYGQDLIIEEGRILFPGGPIEEPGLEVTAIRGDLENVRVGVNVRGSLKQPEFELFSDPSMTQQKQLSYLVLGHAPGESSGGESSLLAQAALALGLKGGNFLAQNIGNKLGLDEVGIESDSDQGEGEQASLVIGKYLSPKLYVSYGIGLLEPISTLRVQYTITNRLQLVTESSGASSGGDVIYTIERGK